MADSALSYQVTSFIDENISAYEDLQVLLLMHDHPGQVWDAVDIAKYLRIEPLSASTHLMNLHSKGLIEHRSAQSTFYGFVYSPYPAAKEEQISVLAAAFERARVEIVDYIFKKNRGQLQLFADAFKVKKDK